MISIDVRNLSKPSAPTHGVHRLFFNVRSRRVINFLDRNCAGKATTLRPLLDPDPSAFVAAVVGRRLVVSFARPLHVVGALLGVGAACPSRTVRGQLALAAAHRISQRAGDELQQEAGVPMANRWIRNFSLGMGQRPGTTAALPGEQEVLILAKSPHGPDPVGTLGTRGLRSRLARICRTVLFGSHPIEKALPVDHLAVLCRARASADLSLKDVVPAHAGPQVARRTSEDGHLRAFLQAQAVRRGLLHKGSLLRRAVPSVWPSVLVPLAPLFLLVSFDLPVGGSALASASYLPDCAGRQRFRALSAGVLESGRRRPFSPLGQRRRRLRGGPHRLCVTHERLGGEKWGPRKGAERLDGEPTVGEGGFTAVMSTADHVATVDLLCAREFPKERARTGPVASGPGFHWAELKAGGRAWGDAVADRHEIEDQYEAEGDALKEVLTERWGPPQTFSLWSLLRRACEGEHIPEPWAMLSNQVPSVDIWSVDGRWIAIGVSSDDEQEVQLLAVVTETDPP